jgi:hypothetical protein
LKTKEVFVSIKFTKNLGNYQSFVAEAGITTELEPYDTVDQVFAETFEQAKAQVRQQVSAAIKNKGEI